MNDKQKIIKLWKYISTSIVNALFLLFTIISGYIWAITINSLLITINCIFLILWIQSFRIQYKTFTIDDHFVEIYAGFSHHYIKVNGVLKDEYVTDLTFTPIQLSCLVNNHKITVTISLANHIVIKCDDELIKNKPKKI